jgi:hypothetical protein
MDNRIGARMNTIPKISRRFALLIATAGLAACATGSHTSRPAATGPVAPPDDPRVLMNGESVAANQRSLLDVLLAKESAHRLGLQRPRPEQPLVLVDGVRVSTGIEALASLPAFSVMDVRVLHHVEAAALYGGRARYGAIVVKTR